jgi:hypothetical protein
MNNPAVTEGGMEDIHYREMVIVCEACHTVQKLPVEKYDDCLDLFHAYNCPNGCGRNLYSFFTVGQLKKG